MKIIRGLHNCKTQQQNGVLSIGNFDGLHLGHQKMLEQLHTEAKRLNTHSALMTFEPLPREYFAAGQTITSSTAARLMNCSEKMRTLNQFDSSLRPNYLLILRFNQTLAKMRATDFITDILVDQLKIKSLIIGDDFRFGCDRQGDFKLLQQYGEKYQFSVTNIKSHRIEVDSEQQRVSSSLIRDALADDQLNNADKMLGRAYTICGHIQHGDKRGRSIGFPTANIHLRRLETPLRGVYSVTMHSLKHGDIAGIANIGKRPTVNGERVQLEVHLFDFEQSLYGDQVCISFQHKIRAEKKFESFDGLKQQIKIDCDAALKLLANTATNS
ncbi:FMN adenylyltransferase / Riboflavin kinase [hydrothermal vent metagenome]|uniref:Bifunctional riboflavin kinase/FMN adenylyltransferase n=1 Tax=hydrothermal vent metagenome TaxID=652676 RepID=A0A3B0X9K8_9ZZZZ